jgi:hypothetical protein
MGRRMVALLGVFLGLGLAGAPAVRAAEAPSGGVAVAYPVPAGAPTGEVDVLSLGVAELPVPSLIGRERFVHMRVAAFNREDARDWLLDAREQTLNLADGSALGPRYATTAGGAAGPPRLTLHRGERGYLDLFFAVDGLETPWLSLSWRVRCGAGEVVLATTVFELLPDTDELSYGHLRPAQYAGGVLWTGPFWCEPRWSTGGWLGPYGHYRRYRYSSRPGGFDVFDGGTRWRYQRDRAPAPPPETVGDRWRGRSAPGPIARPVVDSGGAVAGRARPTTPAPAWVARPTSREPVIERERFSWHLEVEHPTRDGQSSSSPRPSRVGESWRSRASEESSTQAQTSSSSDSSSSSSSSSSGSSSSSSASSSSPPASSSSSGSTVGSHWRH